MSAIKHKIIIIGNAIIKYTIGILIPITSVIIIDNAIDKINRNNYNWIYISRNSNRFMQSNIYS